MIEGSSRDIQELDRFSTYMRRTSLDILTLFAPQNRPAFFGRRLGMRHSACNSAVRRWHPKKYGGFVDQWWTCWINRGILRVDWLGHTPVGSIHRCVVFIEVGLPLWASLWGPSPFSSRVHWMGRNTLMAAMAAMVYSNINNKNRNWTEIIAEHIGQDMG